MSSCTEKASSFSTPCGVTDAVTWSWRLLASMIAVTAEVFPQGAEKLDGFRVSLDIQQATG